MNRPVQSMGFDKAGAVAPGTVIEQVYYALPIHGTTGERYDDLVEALTEAIRQAEAREATNPGYVPVVALDVRWTMRHPKGPTGILGGSTDTVAEHLAYGGPAEAREHLARIVKYATA